MSTQSVLATDRPAARSSWNWSQAPNRLARTSWPRSEPGARGGRAGRGWRGAVPRAGDKRAAAWAKPSFAQAGRCALGADMLMGIEPVCC